MNVKDSYIHQGTANEKALIKDISVSGNNSARKLKITRAKIKSDGKEETEEISLAGPSVNASHNSFTVSGTVYTLKVNTNNELSIESFIAAKISAYFNGTSTSGSSDNTVVPYGSTASSGGVARTAKITPSNTVVVKFTPGTQTVQITKVEFYTKSGTTATNLVTKTSSTLYTGNTEQYASFALTSSDACYLAVKSNTTTLYSNSSGSVLSVNSGSSTTQYAKVYYKLDNGTETSLGEIKVDGTNKTVTASVYKKCAKGSTLAGLADNGNAITSKPSSLSLTAGNGICFFAYPSTWGNASFSYSLGTDSGWIKQSDTVTRYGCTYVVYKHDDSGKDFAYTVNLSGGTAF